MPRVTAFSAEYDHSYRRELTDEIMGGAVDNESTSQTKSNEKVLSFDVPDEALERAAIGERQAFTWVYCTNGYYWYDCNWPQ